MPFSVGGLFFSCCAGRRFLRGTAPPVYPERPARAYRTEEMVFPAIYQKDELIGKITRLATLRGMGTEPGILTSYVITPAKAHGTM